MKKNWQPILWGLLLVAVGIIIFLNIAGITSIKLWSYIVGIVFIVGGINAIANSKKNVFGYFLILIGLFIILKKALGLSFNPLYFIPIIIIVAGVSFIFSVFTFKSNVNTSASSFIIFSGREERTFAPDFKGKSITCIFGGYDIDLREHTFTNDIQFNIFTMFGGADIIVPENVNLQINPTSIFGGISNSTKNASDNQYTIHINTLCFFGGVSICNHRRNR